MGENLMQETEKKEMLVVEKKPAAKHCLQCGNEIFPGSSRFSARKFCSRRCNRRYFSLKRYHKIKVDEDYKTYRKKYYKNWLENNRDKFNKSMREASLRYQRKIKKLRLDKKEKEETFNNAKELNKSEVDS